MGTLTRYGVLLSAVLVGCSGGDKKDDTDARQAFCHEWAAAWCKKIYSCPSPDVELMGTETDCENSWVYLCTMPPKADEPIGANCSGSGTVDSGARADCLNKLNSVSCDDFNGDYSDRCGEVCSAPAATGSGGNTSTSGSGGYHNGGAGGSNSSGAGNLGGSSNIGGSNATGGTSATGGSAPLPEIKDAQTACVAEGYITCDFVFRCLPVDQRNTDETPASCRSAAVDSCATANMDCPNLDVAAAKTCVSKVPSLSCDDFFAQNLPAECSQTSTCL